MGFRRWDKHDYDSDIEVDVKDLAPLVDHMPAKEPGRKPVVHNTDMYNTNITPKSRKGYT